MPKKNLGPKVQERTKRLLEALLAYANYELENANCIPIKFNWQKENELVVKTQVRFLVELTQLDLYNGKLDKEQVKEAIHRLEDLEILKDNRPGNRGWSDWYFTLTLWYSRHDRVANLKRFDEEWKHLRSKKLKQVSSAKSPKIEQGESQPNVIPQLPLPVTILEVPRKTANTKLVVLKLGDGSFEQGFPITLKILEEGNTPLEITLRLPSSPEIPQYYSHWVTSYRNLNLRHRIESSTDSAEQVSRVSNVEIFCNAAQTFRERLNAWLYSDAFSPIREKLLEQLSPSDEILVIIQTEHIWLRQLPWHLWDFFDRYPKAEIVLNLSSPYCSKSIPSTHSKVRILAIIGNSTGINVQADRLLLEQLPNAEVLFLVEPQRHELNDELWKQGWNILFFTGHIPNHANGETHRIYLNKTDCLTLDQLRYAVKKAVERGLQIAIFNSCDGLGLTRYLEDLQIPQIIVMREPVPDYVSQEFLKYFLTAFSRGKSFYLAVREARERLQGLEDRFPCMTWLPMIFHHLSFSPPTWSELVGDIGEGALGGILTTTQDLASIRKKMLVAKSTFDLRAVLYEVEEFLSRNLSNIEARLLKDTVLAALQREKIIAIPCSPQHIPKYRSQRIPKYRILLRVVGLILLVAVGLPYLLYVFIRLILDIFK